MKLIIERFTNICLYAFTDGTIVDITTKDIKVGSPYNFIISDCNSTNSLIYNNVEIPEDYEGRKYIFDGTTWTINPEWT